MSSGDDLVATEWPDGFTVQDARPDRDVQGARRNQFNWPFRWKPILPAAPALEFGVVASCVVCPCQSLRSSSDRRQETAKRFLLLSLPPSTSSPFRLHATL